MYKAKWETSCLGLLGSQPLPPPAPPLGPGPLQVHGRYSWLGRQRLIILSSTQSACAMRICRFICSLFTHTIRSHLQFGEPSLKLAFVKSSATTLAEGKDSHSYGSDQTYWCVWCRLLGDRCTANLPCSLRLSNSLH